MQSEKKVIAHGAVNSVYEFDENKVFRQLRSAENRYFITADHDNINIDFSMISENGRKELTGLFIQLFLSNKCDEINKVIEFGIHYYKEDNVYISNVYAILNKFTYDLFNFKYKFTYNDKPDIFNGLFIDVSNALNCMHVLNYFHLDIKPENIGIIEINETTYKAVLCDFGESMYLSNDCISNDSVRGTMHYRDPFLNDNRSTEYRKPYYICKKNDEYSFGMTIYEICTYNNDDMFNKPEIKIKEYILNLIQPYTLDNLQTIKKNNNNNNLQDILTTISKNIDNIDTYKKLVENRNIINKLNGGKPKKPKSIKRKRRSNKRRRTKKRVNQPI